MTLMGWTISEECALFVKEAEAKLSKKVLYMNEPLEGEKSKFLEGNSFLYYIHFDMNQISIGEEFEDLIRKELTNALEAEIN
jgi:hypothetical protein